MLRCFVNDFLASTQRSERYNTVPSYNLHLVEQDSVQYICLRNENSVQSKSTKYKVKCALGLSLIPLNFDPGNPQAGGGGQLSIITIVIFLKT